MRVLVIEDDPIVADMLQMVLQVEGFSVDVAADGGEGLELASVARPDVIILDVMMPEVDGWAVAEQLQRDQDMASIPIVFCTAKADVDSTWRGWQLGAASYVTKPFDNELLISELIRVTRPTPPADREPTAVHTARRTTGAATVAPGAGHGAV